MAKSGGKSASGPRRVYLQVFKQEAVQMLLDGHSASSVCDRLGLPGWSLLPGDFPVPKSKQKQFANRRLPLRWQQRLVSMLPAIDFTTIEVWTKGGLVTHYLLFVMELKTRRAHFAGCTPNLNERWLKQIAHHLTEPEDGILNGKRYLIIDRDAKFCEAFREILKDEDVKPLRLPPRSPNLNANLQRHFRSLKAESLSRMIFFGEKSLHRAVTTYLEHYHAERIHQGLSNKIIEPGDEVGRIGDNCECRERFGGILKYYYRDAA
jgi:transposase InsO family protein